MELFRLLRRAGEGRWMATWLVFVAAATGSSAEARHAAMEHLLEDN
jgi:hypothetical protein